MKRRLPPFLLICAAVAAWQIAPAAAHGSDMETIVVTASRLDRTLAELSQSATIIDRAEIETRQFANVTELLRQVPGVNIVQQGARGGTTSVVMRGGEANFTVVLIDGIKVNDPTNTRGGSYDFSNLDIGSVERVEIIRGPMSAIYGSDALSGVINIVTRPGPDGAQIQAEIGGHGLQSGRFALGGRTGAVTGSFSVHALQEDGDIEGAHYEDWGMDGSLGFAVGESGEAGLQLRFLDANSSSFPEDSGGPELAVIREADERAVEESHLRLYWDHAIAPAWQSAFAVNRYERNESASSPGIAPGVFDGVPPNSADTDFVRDQLSLSISTELGESAAIAFGGEWQDEDGSSSGLLDLGFPLPTDFQLHRQTLSAFMEVEYAVSDLALLASLRWDDPDDVADEISAQFGALYALPGDNGELRVNWSEGFKAPSFFALAHPLVGNPDLVAETATSLELGYRRTFASSNSVELSIYRNEFENLIDFEPVLFTNVNRSEVVTTGGELSAQWALSDAIDIDLHLSYLDSDIKGTTDRLRSRPNWRGGLGVDWRMSDHWQFAASFLSQSHFWEVSIPTGGRFLDGYRRLDVALSYDTHEHFRFGFAIDNALDEDYYEAVGFPAAGIRGRFSVLYRF